MDKLDRNPIEDRHWYTGRLIEPFFQRHFRTRATQRLAKVAYALFIALCIAVPQAVSAAWDKANA